MCAHMHYRASMFAYILLQLILPVLVLTDYFTTTKVKGLLELPSLHVNQTTTRHLSQL